MDQSKNQEEHCITLDFTSPNTRLESPSSQARKRRNKWGPIEDIVLCNAWLNTSKDCASVGNEQRHESFWKRIANYYNASPKLKGLFEVRESSKCKQRWTKINDAVSKFLGSYEDAVREKSIGQSENDVLRAAYGVYFNDYKVKFNLEHAWIELRNDEKWLELQRGSRKRKLYDQSASSKIITVVKEVQARPEVGKAKGKRNVIVLDSEEQQSETSSESIKEKDLAMRERLGKSKLLNTLLSRKEPLSELESALKDKLITDMLNN